MVLLSISIPLSVQAKPMYNSSTTATPQNALTKEYKITNSDEIKAYAEENDIPLESDGKVLSEVIISIDQKALDDFNSTSPSQISPRAFDVCEILYPYEGRNTNRIAWSTSGTGPCTLSNTITKTTSSEIFGEFTGKTEVVEAKVGFKIGQSLSCTSSYSVNLNAGERAQIVGYFRYKGYLFKYYTWGGLNYVGAYEAGRPIGIDFAVYK